MGDGDSNSGASSLISLCTISPRLGGLFAVGSYAVVSTSITFVNKAVFAWFDWSAPNTLTLAQLVVSLVLLRFMSFLGWITLPAIDASLVRRVFPLSIAFVGMVLTGLASLRLVNIAMYTALRRSATLIVLAGQILGLAGKKKSTVPSNETLSVVFMTLFAMLAGAGDLQYDTVGYALVMLNCTFSASYMLLISRKSQELGLDTFGLMYLNSLLSTPFVAVLVYATEWNDLAAFNDYWNASFMFMFWLSAVMAFLLNYTMFWCSILNSPLTTSITGQVKGILQTGAGLLAFDGVPVTSLLLVGLSLSTLSSLWYAHIKYLQTLPVEVLPMRRTK